MPEGRRFRWQGLLLPPTIDDRLALIERLQHLVQDLIVFFADAYRFGHVRSEVFQEFARDHHLTDQAHAEPARFGLDDDDPLAFDQFAVAFARAATFGLLAEHDDPVDVALVLALGAIPFDRRELLDQQALPPVHRAPVPARHRGLVFAHIYYFPLSLLVNLRQLQLTWVEPRSVYIVSVWDDLGVANGCPTRPLGVVMGNSS